MLEDTTTQRLLEQYEQLRAAGRLFTRQQLDRYYSTFRTRFGPDRLNSVDGEALLELMHETGNRNSLSYWLEFKSDDEFPSVRFGSIAGRSALKFGVFRRQTGEWQAAEKGKPRDISIDEAVEIAMKHREQLLRGAELLERLPSDASDADYERFQQQFDAMAPDVSDRAWAHKYFSLLYPDKLDDFHSPGWQRFHLLKLLQTLPQGAGRYILGGRFVALARQIGVPLVTLGSLLNGLHGRRHRYWRVATRSGPTQADHWHMMLQRSCVAVGWNKTGDLSWVQDEKASRERLKTLLNEKHPSHSNAATACTEITNFLSGIRKGDIVWAADGPTIFGIGRVVGDYSYEPEFDFPHHRSVKWLNLEEWKAPVREGHWTTVRQIRRHDENILETERRIQDGWCAAAEPSETSTAGKRDVPLSGVPGRIQSILQRKKQVILYGPAGTGKTYWAETTACDLASYWAFGKPFEELEPEPKRVIRGDGESQGLVRICCFHAAYKYEDFIEGFRHETVNGRSSCTLRDGIFKQLCHDAAGAPDRRFYLIIDEIDRVDIRRVFGELLTVLERDMRGKSIVLPISGKVFSVPPNVFLIGTLSTADRSHSCLDAVLRRRFGFVELMPDSSVLRGSVAGIPLGPWFAALNRRIRAHAGPGARNLQIGHSYLLQDGLPVRDLLTFKRVLRDDIIPLLEQHCHEDFSALVNILGNGLWDCEHRQIREELFDEGQEDELIQALLEPCPEISTSAEALFSEEDNADDEPPENGP